MQGRKRRLPARLSTPWNSVRSATACNCGRADPPAAWPSSDSLCNSWNGKKGSRMEDELLSNQRSANDLPPRAIRKLLDSGQGWRHILKPAGWWWTGLEWIGLGVSPHVDGPLGGRTGKG